MQNQNLCVCVCVSVNVFLCVSLLFRSQLFVDFSLTLSLFLMTTKYFHFVTVQLKMRLGRECQENKMAPPSSWEVLANVTVLNPLWIKSMLSMIMDHVSRITMILMFITVTLTGEMGYVTVLY